MRVALVHYWLLRHRGGEKVLEAICRLFPGADIFTLFYDPEAVSPVIRSRNVRASWLNPLRRMHRSLLPLMPMALEDLDLRGYDLVLSSEAGPAKGVLTQSTTRHFCYCHTPMRYLWELYPAYRHDFRMNRLANFAFAPIASYLRTWDFASAARVDGFIANSRNVRRRIWKTYRRHARVVYPPVPVETFRHEQPEDYALIVAEMVKDKRLDYAIACFAANGRKLRVVGGGPEYRALRRLAQPNIEFCGCVSDEELRLLYARSSTLVVPGEEDFGMTMVEALASGKPVVALGRGGALEIVRRSGVLYPEPTPASLDIALRVFDQRRDSFRPDRLQARAARFSTAAFEAGFLSALARLWVRESRRFPSGGDIVQLAAEVGAPHRRLFSEIAAERRGETGE